ncbi:hypothetical protein DSLASN_17080 [Desulfoluna limicola]|uniref:diguanylate cyclase n=1 Tax=Desulfoluna limicola TaxID=2810562 RepID=A0ABM7PG04_9BACT|nr:diguanylate cyclase [Desulfoluna limicola]BCS96076.1 hypothetical protein DSLASN_17080 [Desulfoluna limicola]
MLEKWLVEEDGPETAEPCQVSGEGVGVDDMSVQSRLQSKAGVACIGLEPNGNISQWDSCAESLFGYNSEEMTGRHLCCLVPSAEEGETLRGFFKASLRGADISEVSTSCEGKHGDVLICRWYAVSTARESGGKGLAVLVKDVTEQMLAVNDLNHVRQEAIDLFSSSPIGIFQADIRQHVLVANPELSWMLGYESSKHLISAIKDVRSFFAEPEQGEAYLFQLYEGEQLSRFRCRLKRRDGGFVWALCYGQITRNASGRVNGFYGFCIDVSRTVRVEKELKRVNEELRLASILDGLTRISNRRHFDECMADEWSRHTREKASLSVILCDIDNFKLYNDTYGHQAGDRCLVQVAETLTSCIHRSSDLVARYGGEEFVVILPHTDLNGACHVAEVMRRNVEELVVSHEHSDTVSCVTLSLGVASTLPHRESCAEELIRMADRALYAAKEKGRNQWVAREESPDVACLDSKDTTDPE